MKTLPIIVAFFCVGFIFGYTVCNNRQKTQIETRTDTITTIKVDTIIDTLKVYNTKDFIRYDTIFVFLEKDTIFVPIEIPIYEYTFKDSLYFIDVEGYNVKMKKIEVYPKTVYKYITRTDKVEKFERDKPFGIGIQAGYGYNIGAKSFSPYFGLGISYNFIRF